MLSIITAIITTTIIIELAGAMQPFWHKPSVKHLGCTAIGGAVPGVMRAPLLFDLGFVSRGGRQLLRGSRGRRGGAAGSPAAERLAPRRNLCLWRVGRLCLWRHGESTR
eukprot:9268834-Pyramimonas_sp.AAC.1